MCARLLPTLDSSSSPLSSSCTVVVGFWRSFGGPFLFLFNAAKIFSRAVSFRSSGHEEFVVAKLGRGSGGVGETLVFFVLVFVFVVVGVRSSSESDSLSTVPKRISREAG